MHDGDDEKGDDQQTKTGQHDQRQPVGFFAPPKLIIDFRRLRIGNEKAFQALGIFPQQIVNQRTFVFRRPGAGRRAFFRGQRPILLPGFRETSAAGAQAENRQKNG